MGKDRLLRCVINIEKRQRKVGELIIYQKDIAELKGNRKDAFKILCEEFTQRIIDLQDILIKMNLVLTAKEISIRGEKKISVDLNLSKYLGTEEQFLKEEKND